MMRSMFSGVTGLRNHQTKMDVIGNNIANVNTVGFKKSRVTFQDTLSQTMQGASSPQGNRGGTNPMQIGLGMTIASIDTIHSPSSAEFTGNMTDMSIEGDGFFIVADGADRFYTRAGNFDFDRSGNFVNLATGLKVQGWQDKGTHSIPDDRSPQAIGPIEIRKGMTIPGNATTAVHFSKNLDARPSSIEIDEDGNESEVYTPYSIPFKIYDSLGNAHDLKITFTKSNEASDDKNTWTWEIEGADVEGTEDLKLTFDKNGKLTSPIEEGDLPQVTLQPNNGAEDVTFKIDFSGVTQYAKETNIDMTNQDGYAPGTLTGLTTDTAGVITGVFDNGLNRQLAQIALANFDNPGGLIKAGQNMYRYSNNSGEPQIGESGTGGRAAIAPGFLEMSNVDLSEEFTQMIITQRGFQANSRIITTSDEMLQELVNIKR